MAGGVSGQQLNPISVKPISCFVFPSVAMTTKDRRILAAVKFANVVQVRYYKTAFPCTEFVDTKWFDQNRCDRPLNNIKHQIKE